jgi:predicted transcriptional regulator
MIGVISRPRDRLEMLADVVEFLCVTGPQNQTRIMQACNLRHDQVVECLGHLLENKLIEKDVAVQTFKATSLGIDFLKQWTGIFKQFLVSHPKKKHFWSK